MEHLRNVARDEDAAPLDHCLGARLAIPVGFRVEGLEFKV